MSGNIFDDFLSRKTLFVDKEVLRHDFRPKNLPHRKSEIEKLTFNLVEALNGHIPSNMTLYGVTGAGKTAVTSYVCDELEAKGRELNRPVQSIMVNCRQIDTQYRVLSHLGNSLLESHEIDEIPFTGWPTDRVFGELVRRMDKRGGVFVIILDEIDHLVRKAGDDLLYNQLYGRWTVNKVTTESKMRRTLRAEFCTDKHAVRLWSATDIDLIPTAEEPLHSFLSRLGPDVLHEDVDEEVLYNQLKSKKCFRKKGATLMLDQRSFAGLGNYLRSEILFAANIHPDDRPCDLSDTVLRNWAQAIKQVTVQAYETGGVTVPSDVAKAGKQRGEPRRTWRHYAFCRNERPCLKCGTLVVRLRYGGRRLDHCPTCQSPHR